jgi:hypothetical protein
MVFIHYHVLHVDTIGHYRNGIIGMLLFLLLHVSFYLTLVLLVSLCVDSGCIRPRQVTSAQMIKVASELSSEVWKDQNSKKCPGCYANIQKNEGCNHMTCSRCRQEFCWICQQKWNLCPSKPCQNPTVATAGGFNNGRWRPRMHFDFAQHLSVFTATCY